MSSDAYTEESEQLTRIRNFIGPDEEVLWTGVPVKLPESARKRLPTGLREQLALFFVLSALVGGLLWLMALAVVRFIGWIADPVSVGNLDLLVASLVFSTVVGAIVWWRDDTDLAITWPEDRFYAITEQRLIELRYNGCTWMNMDDVTSVHVTTHPDGAETVGFRDDEELARQRKQWENEFVPDPIVCRLYAPGYGPNHRLGFARFARLQSALPVISLLQRANSDFTVGYTTSVDMKEDYAFLHPPLRSSPS